MCLLQRIHDVRTDYVPITDDSVNAGTDKAEIDQVIRDIQRAKLDTGIKLEGDVQDFLGISIDV